MGLVSSSLVPDTLLTPSVKSTRLSWKAQSNCLCTYALNHLLPWISA